MIILKINYANLNMDRKYQINHNEVTKSSIAVLCIVVFKLILTCRNTNIFYYLKDAFQVKTFISPAV